MATDPQTLLSQAACYACFLEMDDVMRLALFAQWAGVVAGGVNVIPGGSHYDGGGNFVLLQPPLVGLAFYTITLGANDTSANIGAVGGPLVVNDHNPHNFQLASNGLISMTGTANAAVSATLIRTG